MSEPANVAEIIARNVVKVSGPSCPRGARLDSRVHNCPCCHKPAYVVTKPKSFSDNGIRYHYIICSGCLVRTGLSSDLEILIQDWNRRIEPREIPDWAKQEIIIEIFGIKRDFNQYAKDSYSKYEIKLFKKTIEILNNLLSLRKPDGDAR